MLIIRFRFDGAKYFVTNYSYMSCVTLIPGYIYTYIIYICAINLLRYEQEILLPSLGLIKHVHHVIDLFITSSTEQTSENINHVYVYKIFPTGVMGEYPPPAKHLLILPIPTKILFSPHQRSIQPNRNVKTSFLAVVIAPVPFRF